MTGVHNQVLLIQASAEALLALHELDVLLPHLTERCLGFQGDPNSGTVSSWATSVVGLAQELVDIGRGRVRMMVEFRPPGYSTSERVRGPIDVLLAGVHPETGRYSYIAVELKQWSKAEPDRRHRGQYRTGYAKPKPHPGEQLIPFYDFMVGEDGPLKDDGERAKTEFMGIVYLENAAEEAVNVLRRHRAARTIKSTLYTGEGRDKLRSLLTERLSDASGQAAVEELLTRLGRGDSDFCTRVRNNPLADVLMLSFGDDHVFTLRGAQRMAFDAISAEVSRALQEGEEGGKSVFAVLGGAGTGKSAIAVELLREFRGTPGIRLSNGTGAFMTMMKDHLGKRDAALRDSLAYTNEYVHSPQNSVPLLICDEAHRMRSKSSSRYQADRRGERPQVEELMDAGQVSVFLLDENQRVRKEDVGTVEEIRKAAKQRKAQYSCYSLTDQWRCGGSSEFPEWASALLGFGEAQPWRWLPDGLIHVEVAGAPADMEHVIREADRAGASARMVAGICWPWSKPDEQTNELPRDVAIGSWGMPWNAKKAPNADGAPTSERWAFTPGGVGQVGCVYTAQGMEWDWCGVILGKDYVWRGDRWLAQREHSQDGRVNTKTNDNFMECVRNAYYVLLTRARRGVVLYSDDEETQSHLRELVPEIPIEGLRRPRWR